jgi:NAD(P)-dependent dehydrogenase (short-subunit alcohol dehydrogenase family)
MELRGASVLVTGAGRGIGRAIALGLGREGARVALVSRTASELEAVAGEIRKAGGAAVTVPGDLRDPAFPARSVEAAVAAHGRLQVLVNNAGIGVFASFAETTDAMWDDVLGTNLTAVFRLTRAALPHLTKGGGQIFMISSLAGQNAIGGLSAYCASKAALDHLAACLMLEVRGAGVKVTVLAPGSVDTGFAGMPRAGDTSWMLQPEDLAAAVLDLLQGRDAAHLSRVEMRPAQPQKRG